MSNTILKYIQENLIDEPDGEEVTLDDDLLGSGLVDSVGMMNLIVFIEEKYELKIPPRDMVIENFKTVGHIENYLAGRKAN